MATPSPKLTFHFPVAASPEKILILLRVLVQADEPILKGDDLDQLALDLSSHANRFTEARILAEQALDVIEQTGEGLQANARAQVLLKKREPIQYDLLHYLFWTAWRPEGSGQHQARSWLYRTLCNDLWGMGQARLDLETRRQITETTINQAIEDFQTVQGFSLEAFSAGRQTIAGGLEWLRHLKPPVLEGEMFSRRAACSGELFLLALSRSYQMTDSEVGMDLLLTPQRRDDISRLCLLEPLQFDRMLDWVLAMFPYLIAPGTRAGSYGRFVRLHRSITLEDFI